jgi:transposase-like protein
MNFNLTHPVFHDETKAREYLESLHWPEGPVCPRCESMRATKVGGDTARPGLYMCNDCRRQFTVTVGTIFEDSKIPLSKWLLAFRLLNGGKKGISANELSRHLGITYKSAWFLAHRVREAMKDGNPSPLGGKGKTVEVDETFVGGKKGNRASRKVAPRKTVLSLVERGGKVRSFHIARIHANTIRGAIVTNIDRNSHLMSDDARFYWAIGREFASHGTTLHNLRQFAVGEKHSNTAENFFSIFKRGVIGTYHQLSEAHMHRYCYEFDFRYNTRNLTDAERTAEALKGARGKRLMYRQPSFLGA